VAIKEASFDAKRFVETVRIVRTSAPEVAVLNGNDNFLLEAYLLGAEGSLLGFGTLGAREQVAMLDAVRAGELGRAKEFAGILQPLCDAVFDPPVRDYRARIKHLLWTLEVIDHPYVRPPLLPLSPEDAARVERAWKEASLA
jgi:dihydrodipicolinate synthase/N-acetylneuraminate lyase